MNFNYTVTFHNSKKASFGGSADIEQLKEDGTEKTVDEIMVEVKESLLLKYKPFFAVWQDITAINVVDNNKNMIFKCKQNAIKKARKRFDILQKTWNIQ